MKHILSRVVDDVDNVVEQKDDGKEGECDLVHLVAELVDVRDATDEAALLGAALLALAVVVVVFVVGGVRVVAGFLVGVFPGVFARGGLG